MAQISSAQQLLAYLVIDRTKDREIEARINIIQRQLNFLSEQLYSNSFTRSHVNLKVIEAYAATVGKIEPTSSHRVQLSGRLPGCDLGRALQEILSTLEKGAGMSKNRKIEIFVLLASKPLGNWEDGIRALAKFGARVSTITFSSQTMDEETLTKIKTQDGTTGRWERIDSESMKKTFGWIADSLQHSVASMGQAPTAQPRAVFPSPQKAQKPPRPTAAPQQSGSKPSTTPPPQKPQSASEPVPPSQPSKVEPPPPLPEAQVRPAPSEVGQGLTFTEDVVPPAENPEPVQVEDQEEPSESLELDLGVLGNNIQHEEEKAISQGSASPDSDELSIKEEDVSVGSPDLEEFETVLPVEEAVSGQEETPLEDASEKLVAESEPVPPRATKDGVATIWRELEPTDPNDPVPHTDIRTLEMTDGWRMVGASRRGKMHAHKGIYREDAFALGKTNSWHLLVVADGGGSCPLSRVGSQLAADTAVEIMARYVTMKGDLSVQEVCEMALRKGLEGAWKALETEAEKRQIPLGHLGTTFLSVLHRPDEHGSVVGVAQVGDGLVAVEFTDGAIKALAEPDVGETAGVTLFLTSKHWREWLDRVNVETLETSPQLLAAMCDGVADDFIPFEQHLHQLFERLGEVLEQERPDQALLDLLGYEKRGSFDDRTLALIYQTKAESEVESRADEQTIEKQAEESNLKTILLPSTPDSPETPTTDKNEEDQEEKPKTTEPASTASTSVSDSPDPSISDTVEEDRGTDDDNAA